MARFVSGLEITPWALNKAGETMIQFDCMPQRFLISGEAVVSKTANGYITNPTLFDALPLIVVYGSGSGTLTVGSTVVKISDIATSVTLNCETKRAYNSNTPRDSTITGQFPVLVPGRNNIRFTGGVSRVDITPRWWTV
jgi:phage-related protein